jgi:hypothetical protein
MTGMFDLWLPILLASVAVFIVSSVIHMAPLWHKNDYPRVPDEDKVRSVAPTRHPASTPDSQLPLHRTPPRPSSPAFSVPPSKSRSLSPAF